MKYFHSASNTQINRLLTDHATIADLKTQFQQPAWCGYPGALDGNFGCWSLMDLNGLRKRISPRFCQSCECFIDKK